MYAVVSLEKNIPFIDSFKMPVNYMRPL